MSDLLQLLQRVSVFLIHVINADNTTEDQQTTAETLDHDVLREIDKLKKKDGGAHS